MRKSVWLAGLAAAMGIVLWCPENVQAAQIPAGLLAGGQDVGGLTKDEAEEKIRGYVDSMKGQKITLQIGDRAAETTAEELGFFWSNEEAVDEAVSKVTEGNLLKRYMAVRDLQQAGSDIPLETAVDGAKVETFVNANSSELGGGAKDASITRENGSFVITPGEKGITVDIEATVAALNEALNEGLDAPIYAEASITESEPRIKTEDLETIQDVLGTFTTDFSSSGSARSKNLQVGASKINGHVLMPGETLSGYECLQPFTRENGYSAAASYQGGKVVDSLGGGVCQIATTLYNMALQAELEITQRQNHSMIVTYVKPSMDAAIAGTVKDIKITNNYSTPIYIEGYTEGRKLTFTCYGKETRPSNRKVEYVSETLGRTDPGAPIEQVDHSLAPGARVKVQSSHAGLRSRLWKVVTVDGQEVERTLLSTDTYNASKAIYRVGPAVQEVPVETQPVTEPEMQPAETQPAAPVEGIEGGPGVGMSDVPAPETTAAPAPETAAAPQPETAAAPGPEPAAPVPETAAAPAP